jgi:hypothetical protein
LNHYPTETKFIHNIIELSGNYSQLHCFQLRTTLNGMDFKFVSHGLWSEEQNILLQHMHKKEFWILTNKCGNKLKRENEVEGPRGAMPPPQPRFRV